MKNDASPVVTSDEVRFRSDMENAPLGKKIQAINEGGVAVYTVLNRETAKHYIEWLEVPKRALKPNDQDTTGTK